MIISMEMDFDIDSELDSILSPEAVIRSFVINAKPSVMEFVLGVVLDCGLALATNRDIVATNEEKFKTLEKEINDWNQKGNAVLYTTRMIGMCCRCYTVYKAGDRKELARRIFLLTSSLDVRDSYWLDQIIETMESFDV